MVKKRQSRTKTSPKLAIGVIAITAIIAGLIIGGYGLYSVLPLSRNLSNSQAAASNGLVAYYNFNGNFKNSIDSKTASCPNHCPTFAAKESSRSGYNKSGIFNGSNDSVQYTKTDYNIDDFTIAVWFYREANSTGEGIVEFTNSNKERRGIYLASDGLPLVIYGNNKFQIAVNEDQNRLATGQWHHLIFSYTSLTGPMLSVRYLDQNNNEAYRLIPLADEVKVANPGTIANTISIGDVLGEKNGTAQHAYFKGKIEEVKVYNHSLAESAKGVINGVPGDINHDGAVDAIDVQLVANKLLNIDIGTINADINCDGSVNGVDLLILVNHIMLGSPSGQYKSNSTEYCTINGVPGDVNNDGVANAIDVQLVTNKLLNIDIGDANADVNCDGSVNAVDLFLVNQNVLGALSSGQYKSNGTEFCWVTER